MRKAVWIAAILAVVAACGFGFKAQAAAAADIMQVGATAPNFTLPSQEDKPISLSEFKGKWVVLYFYPDHKVVDAYGVPVMTHGDMKYASRDTFLISPDGKIVKVWEKVDPNVHSADVLAEIAANKK
jgi:peroxiredoxin Q/BCP